MGCQNNTNRLIHFDLMRIIACFLVVLIHVGIFDQLKDVPNQSIDTVTKIGGCLCSMVVHLCYI